MPTFFAGWAAGLIVGVAAVYLLYLLAGRRRRLSQQSNTERYHKTMAHISQNMVQAADPIHLARLIARYVHNYFQVDHVGILLKDPEKDCFVFKVSRGEGKVPAGLVKMDETSALVKWFGTHRRKDAQLLAFREVDLRLGKKTTGDPPEVRKLLQAVHKEMRTFHASFVSPSFYKDDLMAILLLGTKNSYQVYTPKDLSLLATLSNDVAMTVRNTHLFMDLQKSNEMLKTRVDEVEKMRARELENMRKTVHTLAEVVTAKDAYTGGHIDSVAEIGIRLGEEVYTIKGIEMTEQKRDTLLTALLLHDLGKVGTPDAILKKPSSLSPDEWVIMREHVDIGARILAPLDYFKEAADAIQHHHESWDGSGYPHGLKGEDIPLEARIVSLADAYHAMTSDRRYHKGISNREAIKRLRIAAGIQFDPFITAIFVKMLEEDERAAA